MTISEMEEAYQQLHEQSLRGELDDEEFKSEVERLRFEDDLGRRWKIGWYTGKWYRYDQGQWVQGKPPELQDASGPAVVVANRTETAQERTKRSGTFFLVPTLIILLILAAAALLIGWGAGWWGGQSQSVAVTATVVASNTPALSTNTPIPTEPVPTATFTPQPSPEPTDAPTRTPQPTATPTATPSETPTPVPSPTEAASVETSPEPPKTPILTGDIYFPVYDLERQTFDIAVFELETGNREIVVKKASQPGLSHDAKRLAFRSWDRAQRGVLVRELADGHTWVWINFSEAERPSWSPDNQNIVFPSQQESDRGWRIYRTFGLESDRVRRHGGDIFGRVPVWLTDGRIVYWECPLDKCGLYVMQSDGTQHVRLTTYEHDTAPAASPDGSWVAFMSTQDGNWEIYLVDTHTLEGQGVRRLTQDPARDGVPIWSPDGKWLAFLSDRSGVWAVWAMRPDGSNQQKLFDLGGPLEGPIAFAADGEQHGWTLETLAWGP